MGIVITYSAVDITKDTVAKLSSWHIEGLLVRMMDGWIDRHLNKDLTLGSFGS